MNKLTNIKHYRKDYVRALYGRFGKSTGLNPGILWPRKEELKYLKQYEETFCPKLDDLLSENMAIKEERMKVRKEREEEVYNNIQKLPGEFKKFFDKVEAQERQKNEYIRQREARIEEVREILGFRAKPSDERFQKALAEKEEEEIKAKRKEARKKRENSGLDEMLVVKKD